MTLGAALGLGVDAYLLLGVPLTVAFQRLVAKRPLSLLWLRGDAAWSTKSTLIPAAMLALFPVSQLCLALDHDHLVGAVYFSAALVGALPAGRSVGTALKDRSTVGALPAVLAFAISAAVGISARTLEAGKIPGHQDALVTGVESFLQYLPISFVIEEVAFRGMLDTYLTDATRDKTWGSAVIISALWGIWHLPAVSTSQGVVATAAGLVLFQVLVGVGLSWSWRRSGNLIFPAAAHSLADAVRNAVLL